MKELNIVLATDIHLGIIVSNSRLNILVEKINKLNPDIVLFAGDIVDEDLKPVIENNLGETLKTIKSKYGIYAVAGNHEFIGGVTEAEKYLLEHNINVLRDSVIKINESFILAGRDDNDKPRFTGENRKPLSEILANADRNYPLILMDHQPRGLNEAVENGVDLQVSGHTHHGQLWPLNYITGMIYEISWGYRKIENTHFYVSSGFGTWGPPVRTGNHPEIVNLRITFE